VTRFGETLIQFLVTHGENRGTIYLKRDTILGEFLCLFKLKTNLKTMVTNIGEKSVISTSRDG